MPSLLTYEEASREPSIYYANSYSRLRAILAIHPRMQPDEWLRLLGENWSICDNLWQFTAPLEAILGTCGPLLPMMAEAELKAYELLPQRFVVYRGAGERNKAGISWSLRKETARQFPLLNRYHASDPTLYVAEVRKQNVLALKLDRDEEEIVTFGAQILSEEPITSTSKKSK